MGQEILTLQKHISLLIFGYVLCSPSPSFCSFGMLYQNKGSPPSGIDDHNRF